MVQRLHAGIVFCMIVMLVSIPLGIQPLIPTDRISPGIIFFPLAIIWVSFLAAPGWYALYRFMGWDQDEPTILGYCLPSIVVFIWLVTMIFSNAVAQQFGLLPGA